MKQSIRRLILFILIATAALCTGLFTLDGRQIFVSVIYFGYFNTLIGFAGMVLALLYLLQKQKQAINELIPRQWSARIGIIAVTALLLAFESAEFKVVFDEMVIAGTAMMMHFDRMAGMPGGAQDYHGSFVLLDSTLDKRPLFYPFLISLVHDLTGYRYQNAFWLNGVLSLLLVWLIYILARLFSNHRGGLLALLLTATLPMLGIYASSGHFEILNLVMLCAVTLLAYHYLKTPAEGPLVALVFALFLLSQVRYENVVFLLPFGILILLGWRTAGRVVLPMPVIAVPLLFVVPLWHYRQILDGSGRAFQEGLDGREASFALQYAVENLRSAGEFLFSIGMRQPNSYLLSVMGICAVFYCCHYCWRRARQIDNVQALPTTLFVLLMAIFIHALVIVFFYYGYLHLYITHRLSLPWHLLFILLVPMAALRYRGSFAIGVLMFSLLCGFGVFYVLEPQRGISAGLRFAVATLFATAFLYAVWKRKRRSVTALMGLIAAFGIAVSLPVARSHAYSQIYKSNDLVMQQIDFVARVSQQQRILWLSNQSYAGYLNRVPTAPLIQAANSPQLLRLHLQREHFDAIYMPRFLVRDDDGSFRPHRNEPDIDWLDYEVVEEIRMGLDGKQQFLRIRGIIKDPVAPQINGDPHATSAVQTQPHQNTDD